MRSGKLKKLKALTLTQREDSEPEQQTSFGRVGIKGNEMKTFKDVAKYYLGTGLKVQVINRDLYTDGNEEIGELMAVYDDGTICIKDVIEYSTGFKNVTPFLHPLSRLTEQITVEGYNDGKPFVSLLHLLSIDAEEEEKWELYKEVPEYWKAFIENFKLNGGSNVDFGIMNQLINWHFNVFGLLESEYINKKELTTPNEGRE